MQLVTFEHQGVQRVGLIDRERVIDVNRAYAALLAQRGDPRASSDGRCPRPVRHDRHPRGGRTSA